MPDPAPHAIFLSYARDDAAAAQRIAEALRSQGIEVWFDQNELRGGDTWDAKIKKQIRECSLFMPVVSAQTQQRHEGYFRREWKLAVERTNDMAAGVAFIVPVVVDDTPESEAAVPEEFMRVQWTRLPGALPGLGFTAQVARLLDAPRKAAAAGRTQSPAVAPIAVATSKSRFPVWVAAAPGVAVLGGIGFMAFRPAKPNPLNPEPKTQNPEPCRSPAANDKSIARTKKK